MTEHEHMPPINRDEARWLAPGKITLVIDGREIARSRDEALSLALAITEVLQLEVAG